MVLTLASEVVSVVLVSLDLVSLVSTLVVVEEVVVVSLLLVEEEVESLSLDAEVDTWRQKEKEMQRQGCGVC